MWRHQLAHLQSGHLAQIAWALPFLLAIWYMTSSLDKSNKEVRAAAWAVAQDVLRTKDMSFETYTTYKTYGYYPWNGMYLAQSNVSEVTDKRLMIKVVGKGKPETLPGVERERSTVEKAGSLGISPAYYHQTVDPHVIVMDYIDVPHISFQQTQEPVIRKAFIDLLKILHSNSSLFEDYERLPLTKLDIDGWRWWREKDLPHVQEHLEPIDTKQLEKHMLAVLDELFAAPVQQVFCHFDTLRRNMVWLDDKLWLIDWGEARWGDPIRDLAKFFGFNQLLAHDMPLVLEWYYGREATQAECRHFLLLLQAMAIDHLAWKLKDKVERELPIPGRRYKVTHILNLASALSDLPPVTKVNGP